MEHDIWNRLYIYSFTLLRLSPQTQKDKLLCFNLCIRLYLFVGNLMLILEYWWIYHDENQEKYFLYIERIHLWHVILRNFLKKSLNIYSHECSYSGAGVELYTGLPNHEHAWMKHRYRESQSWRNLTILNVFCRDCDREWLNFIFLINLS